VAPNYVEERRPMIRLAAVALTALLLAACGRLDFITGHGQPPRASLRIEPARGPVPLDTLVDSSASQDSDGSIVLRELSLNGGAFQEIDVRHRLKIETTGSHRVSLRVTDDSGSSALAESTVVAEPGSAGTTGYRIDVLYPQGRVSGREREAFEAAARRWSEVIVGDLPDTQVRAGQVEQACGSDYRFSGLIDDLLLFGDLQAIDGPGGVVGMAGACLLAPNGFPLVGLIVLDRADSDFLAASGDLYTVVLHELGHVLDMNLNGWERRGLLEHDRPGCYESSTVRFTGEEAGREFARLGGGGYVPVEDNGVWGTACSHWNEKTFHNELMTGYLDKDARLSAVSGAALSDMGYRVDLNATDEYTLPDPYALRPQAAGPRLGERLLPVGGMLDEHGELESLPSAAPLDLDLRLPAPEGPP
jgi:hypothetical protein